MRALLAIFAFCLCAGATSNANALLCQAIVGCSCTVSAQDIDFGDFSPLQGNQEGLGQVTVDCTGVIDVAPTMVVQMGSGQWGTINARKMRSPAGDLLAYNLYTTGGYGVVWGDGTSGNATVTVSGGLLAVGHWRISRDVNALAAPLATTKPGEYTDTVVVRITW